MRERERERDLTWTIIKLTLQFNLPINVGLSDCRGVSPTKGCIVGK